MAGLPFSNPATSMHVSPSQRTRARNSSSASASSVGDKGGRSSLSLLDGEDVNADNRGRQTHAADASITGAEMPVHALHHMYLANAGSGVHASATTSPTTTPSGTCIITTSPSGSTRTDVNVSSLPPVISGIDHLNHTDTSSSGSAGEGRYRAPALGSSSASGLFHPLETTNTPSEPRSPSATTTASIASSSVGIALAAPTMAHAHTAAAPSAPSPASASAAVMPTRPPNYRSKSNSSVHSVSSTSSSRAGATTRSAAHHASPGGSVAGLAGTGGGSSSRQALHEDEIEASLRQWRNHVFPSLKAGNYVSPGQETPDKDPIHPLVEPILPGIFASSSTSPNARAIPVHYKNGREFLKSVCEAGFQDAAAEAEAEAVNADADVGEGVEGAQQIRGSAQSIGEAGKSAREMGTYQTNWRLEMVLGQTDDLILQNENAEGTWMALWSGSQETGTRLLEFCLMKLPSRPLVLCSPIPIALLPTALLQDRMQTLLSAFLNLPHIKSNPNPPFSLIMGPTRVVEAFLLHYDSQIGFAAGGAEGMFEQSVVGAHEASPYPLKLSHPKYTAMLAAAAGGAGPSVSGAQADATDSATAKRERTRAESAGAYSSSPHMALSTTASNASTGSSPVHATDGAAAKTTPPRPTSLHGYSYNPAYGSGDLDPSQAHGRHSHHAAPHHAHKQMFHHSTAPGRTVKPLYHTRATLIPPAVSLSEGFAVRLADDKDDLRTLVTLFQAYSLTLDHSLEENAARRALQKAMANKSVWIYHIYSQSLPGLSLIAGFLTTERQREYITLETLNSPSRPHSEVDVPPSEDTSIEKKKDGKGKGSVAVTAVFTEESYRGRGVAESLVRTATRHYLVDLKYDYISVYVDPRNESTCRVFSRVGYGIGERAEKEQIPVKLLQDALTKQWDEERKKQLALLAEHNSQAGRRIVSSGSAKSGLAHSSTLSDETDEGAATPTDIKTISSELYKATVAAQQAAVGEKIPMTPVSSGHVIPSVVTEDAGVKAAEEDGRPLCRSYEEWQVVSLKPREASLSENRTRLRGQPRREDKRLSTEGPWQ